jgi:hypothetical protein
MIMHTPGPWKEDTGVIMGDYFWIAQMELTGGEDELGEKIQKANARLIAAAPDLLAMLKTVTAELEAEVKDTYNYCTDGSGKLHPALVRRYERDMLSVRNAQALIAAIEGAEAQP